MKFIKIIVLLVLVATGIGINGAFSGDLDEFQKNYTRETEKTQKKEINESKDSDEKEKTTTNDIENDILSESRVEEKQEENSKNSTQSSNNDQSHSTKKENVSPKKNESTQVQTQEQSIPQQSPQLPQTPPPQTAWDKLGISEYDYYNTPLIAGDYKDFNNSSQCSRFLDIIESDLDLLGGYQDVLGKYTGGVIGCRVRIYIDGNVYSLSQFKNTQYYTNEIKLKINAL